MNPWLILAGVLALAVAATGGYVKGGRDNEAEHLRTAKVQQEARDKALKAAAAEIAKIDVRNVTIQGKVIERVRTEKVYSESRHSPDSWALIQEAYR